jgi:GH24 family phage-related lysozyme (muramidase)
VGCAGLAHGEFANDWAKEKGRIKDLQWWSEVAGKHGFSGNPTIFHFHCVGLIENFSVNCPPECCVEYYELEINSGKFKVSKEAFQFILNIEKYEEFPHVPTGGASGVTIGYGYDLGQQTEAMVRTDLVGVYSEDKIEKLVAVIGKKTDAARTVLTQVSDISISKDNAMTLAIRMKKRYAESTANAYSGVLKLHPHCQGALLLLVINRGTSFTIPTVDSRREMKQIGEDLQKNDPDKVPERFRSMKRLWENTGQNGLIKRREEEAKCFEKGLKCDCLE